MNEDLKKKNKRNNIIILTIAVLIIVGVIAGFGIHNHRVEHKLQQKNMLKLTLTLMLQSMELK